MAYYLGIDKDGVAVSGIWGADSLLPDGQTLVEAVPGAVQGWIFDGTNWSAPLVGMDELRKDRDSKISKTDWIVNRHRDEVDAGGATTLTAEEYQAWLKYRDDLRNMPEGYTPVSQPVFPSIPNPFIV